MNANRLVNVFMWFVYAFLLASLFLILFGMVRPANSAPLTITQSGSIARVFRDFNLLTGQQVRQIDLQSFKVKPRTSLSNPLVCPPLSIVPVAKTTGYDVILVFHNTLFSYWSDGDSSLLCHVGIQTTGISLR